MTRGKNMKHQIYRVIDFEIIDSFILNIQFSDGKHQIVDFRPVLEGELFGTLKDEKLFNQVEIDPEVHTLVWPNGADFDPETLHDWPHYAKEMKKKAAQWAKTKARVAR
jgi:hypothetical protein